MNQRTVSHAIRIGSAALLLCSAIAANGLGEERQWNDNSGKFSVMAELVDANDEQVTLKTAEGKTLTVPRSKLGESDLEFVAQFEDEQQAKKQIRLVAAKFFNSLKKGDEERDEQIKEVITSAARTKLEGSGSEIKNLPKPDRSAKAAVRSVDIDGASAEAVVRLRFKGKSITATLMVRKDGDQWLAYGITGPDENDEEKTILFEDEDESATNGAADDIKDEPASAAGVAGADGGEREGAVFDVPKGGIQKLLKFIDETMASKPATKEDAAAHGEKVANAVEQAANKILTHKAATKHQKSKAGRYLVDAAMVLYSADSTKGTERIGDLPDELARRGLKDVAPYAKSAALFVQLQDASSRDEARDVIGQILTHLDKTPITETEVELAEQTAQLAEVIDYQFASEACARLSSSLGKSDLSKQLANLLGAKGRRFGLIGNEMKVAGITPDGNAFDMSEFKGKVILVDFWATWCGPCKAELPNVLANYEKYHEKGFEVVAISIDGDLDALESYLQKENPPWTVLADRHPKNKESVAGYYGVDAIPATVLIGADGKVITLKARGSDLVEELEKLFGEPS